MTTTVSYELFHQQQAAVPRSDRIAEFARIFLASALPLVYVIWILVPLSSDVELAADERFFKLLTAPLCIWVYWMQIIHRAIEDDNLLGNDGSVRQTIAITFLLTLNAGLAANKRPSAWPVILGASVIPLAMNACVCVRRRIVAEEQQIRAQQQRQVDVAMLHWYLNGLRAAGRRSSSSSNNRLRTAAAMDDY